MIHLEDQLSYFGSFIPYFKEIHSKYEGIKKNLRKLRLDILELLSFVRDEQVTYQALLELRLKAQQYFKLLHKKGELLNNVTHDYTYVLKVLPGVGGEEATLFAKELLAIYSKWLSYKKIPYQVTEDSLLTSSKEVDNLLQSETGTHRVKRVPVTEAKGRIHTSTVVVNGQRILANLNFDLNDRDLRFEEMRSSGAGGQHVNKTNSAVRVIHVPTGVFVKIGTSRDKFKNKETALTILRQKLIDQVNDYIRSLNQKRQETLTVRERSSKIRTYDFPKDRIVDNRTSLSANLTKTLSSPENFDMFLIKVNQQ